MIKYLEAYCDLNEIEPIKEYVRVAKILEENKEKEIHTSHIHGFLFFYFHELIHDQITLEDFMKMGDIYASFNIYDYQQEHPAGLDEVSKILKMLKEGKLNNTLIIIDSISFTAFQEANPELDIEQLFSKNNSILTTL